MKRPHKGKGYTGRRFGALVALKPTAEREHNAVVWRMRCECGTIVDKAPARLASQVRVGRRPSCGCLLRGAGSPFFIDLSGARFGALTALSVAETPHSGQGVEWLCQCDCGLRSIVRTKDLRLGSTRSCGCGARRRSIGGNRWAPTVVAGAKFNMLTVLGDAHTKDGLRYVRVRCDCGVEAVKRANLVSSGQTRSCGCLRKRSPSKSAANRQRAIDVTGPSMEACRVTPMQRLGYQAPALISGSAQ